MAVIKANCSDMYQRAEKIREDSAEMHKLIADAYLAFENIQSIWSGNSYNVLINEVNTVIEPLNKMLRLINSKIPYIIQKVSYNYAVADEQKDKIVNPIKGENLTKINPIKVPEVEQLVFLSAEVELFKIHVSQKLKSAEDLMNVIESTYQNMLWQGKAAKEFNDKVSNLKKYMLTTISDLRKYIEQYIDKIKEEMESAENANKV